MGFSLHFYRERRAGHLISTLHWNAGPLEGLPRLRVNSVPVKTYLKNGFGELSKLSHQVSHLQAPISYRFPQCCSCVGVSSVKLSSTGFESMKVTWGAES